MNERYYYLDNAKGTEAKDVLQEGDEFMPPPHWKYPQVWTEILPKRIGQKPCGEPQYRRRIK